MRSFLAATFLFAITINGAMLYRTPVKAASVHTASWLKTDKITDRVISSEFPPNVFPGAKAVKTESIRPNPSVAKVSKAKQHSKRQRHQRRNARRSTRYAATE